MSNNEELVKVSLIIFDVPFMINLPDGDYNINIDNTYTTVKLEKHTSPHNMAGLPRGVQFPSDSFIIGDRWGKFNYTRVHIIFHHHVFIKPSVLFPDFLLTKSVEIINRIFSVCRGIKGEHYIKINVGDIFSYNVFYFDSNGNQRKDSVSVPIANSMVAMAAASEPTNEQLRRIREILSTNAQLPLFQELIFDAWDYHFYGNYRIAVIEVGTAFEVFIDDFIWKQYIQRGKSEADIENILETGLKNLLCDHIKILTGHDFCSTQEYNNWEKNAYDIRNDTVHKGKIVSDVESSNAILTVTNTIKFLMSLR